MERLSKEAGLALFRQMTYLRTFEEKVIELQTEGKVPGRAGTQRGQEAVSAGVCGALKPTDLVTSTHRGTGHVLAKGGDPFKMLAEIMGRVGGYSKGKGGKFHVADMSVGLLGTQGIVGGSLPHAVGAALAAKMRGLDQVVCCFFGDGASNNGTFHESLNMASLWKVPVIFVCENNLYGFSVSLARSTSVPHVADRAAAYGMRGEVVDGNDVLAVLDATRRARAEVASGGKPVLLEALTYRWDGHMIGDPGTSYRSAAEVAAWKERDPIRLLGRHLIDMLGVDQGALDRTMAEVRQEVDAVVKRALASPDPEASVVTEDLFVGGSLGWV